MTRIDGVVYVNGHPTEEVVPESHRRTLEELSVEEEVVNWLGKLDEVEDCASYTNISGVPAEEFWSSSETFPPTCYYLGDEDREAVGQILGNWMAYTEDVYDELIGRGVDPKDLVYMVNWKRD